MDAELLARLHPTLYHMAEEGSWPSIRQRGLLSTKAIVDLYRPDGATTEEILSGVRRRKITLKHDSLPDITIRDQLPAKFLDVCMNEDASPGDYLDALNSRVFFWVSLDRLKRLLNARPYRNLNNTVLRVETSALIRAYQDHVQLAPYNTGSMHVPTAPKRGPDVFVDLADYPYDEWARRRGSSGEPVVELTVRYAIPDITSYVIRVERWADGHPEQVLYQRPLPRLLCQRWRKCKIRIDAGADGHTTTIARRHARRHPSLSPLRHAGLDAFYRGNGFQVLAERGRAWTCGRSTAFTPVPASKGERFFIRYAER